MKPFRRKTHNPKARVLAGIYAEAALNGSMKKCRDVTKTIDSDDSFAYFFLNLTFILSQFGKFLDDAGVDMDVQRFFYELKSVGNNEDLV